MSLTIADLQNNVNYQRLLAKIGGLSRLFSENSTPFLHYRIAENLFCRSFSAKNLAREDTAYDSLYVNTGVGVKTFVMPTDKSTQKIAEFDKLSSKLTSDMSNLEIAKIVAQWRNERIQIANQLYGITDQSAACYHIIARRANGFFIFNTSYDLIDFDAIKLIRKKRSDKSIAFTDGKNNYFYYPSKSTLFKEFYLPTNPSEVLHVPVKILEDPFVALENLDVSFTQTKQREHVVLPLYSTRLKGEVAQKSGLNQWNAKGRPRDLGEVYIPIPRAVHKLKPNFFPARDTEFNLILPDGDCLRAKICQGNEKALMSNPNKALGEWLLRKVFCLAPGELLTREHLDRYGMDSIVIEKDEDDVYYAVLTSEKHYSEEMTLQEMGIS